MEPIFHIAEQDAWHDAQERGEYTRSTRGKTLADVGFIHLSRRHQVERVANAAYRDAGALVLLTIDPGLLGTNVKEEKVDGVEKFPHLYGPLPVGAVVGVEPLLPGPGGLFVPHTSWLNSKLEARPSPIAGLGLFALAPIEVGEPVGVMGGRVVADDELARPAAMTERPNAPAIDAGLNILFDQRDHLALVNHCCDPNLWLADPLALVARRSIQAGDEATVDYAMMLVDESWRMHCRCDTSMCRGVITGSDWRRRELQERYQRHFSPFIERLIR